jgi:prepilin-type N-terminal cleavage/methylation domain-containing protein
MKIETNNRQAFTLIEMILALGVAAIVLILVNTVLFAAIHLRDVTQETVDAGTPMDQTMTVLRRDLECMVTPTNGTSKFLSGSFKLGNVSSPGVAGAVGIEMYTATGALSDSAPWADIQRVTYELKSPASGAGPGQDLYRSVTRNLLSVSTPAVDDQYLMSGVVSLKFSGYDGASWNDTWDTSSVTAVNTNLPLAVRVEIQMSGNNATEEPITLVVPVDSVSRTNMVLATTTTGN